MSAETVDNAFADSGGRPLAHVNGVLTGAEAMAKPLPGFGSMWQGSRASDASGSSGVTSKIPKRKHKSSKP